MDLAHPAHQPHRQRLRLFVALYRRRGRCRRASRAPWARRRCRGPPPQDEMRPDRAQLGQELPGGGLGARLPRAARSDRASHRHRRRSNRSSTAWDKERRDAFNTNDRAPLRRDPRLSRLPLPNGAAQRHRLLARRHEQRRAVGQPQGRDDRLVHGRQDLEQEVMRQEIGGYYLPLSWHCMLAGYGNFPSAELLKPARAGHRADRHGRGRALRLADAQ